MRNEGDLREVLASELRVVAEPAGLWGGVQARLDGRTVSGDMLRSVWVFAMASLLVIAGLSFSLMHGRRELDLGSYLAPVQEASLDTSASAISGAPPHFETVGGAGGQLAGYQVTARRETRVGGETVRQVILTAAGNAVALFISSPKVRLDAGPNRWVDADVDGVACKRLNCARVRTAQFSCLQQTCVLICKACSDRALSALMSEVGGAR